MKKKRGRPKLYAKRAFARLTRGQAAELRLVRATLGKTASDSDAIRYLLDQSACGRRLKLVSQEVSS